MHAIGFAYGALLEGFWNGPTIGKRLFHLRVIDEAGLPLRIEQAWVRNPMRVFDALPFAYLVGGISVLSSPLMQRFGDRVAGTLVIWQTPLSIPGEESWTRQKYNSFMEYPTIAAHLRRAATPELASLIQDALRRRNQLASYTRGKSIASWPRICRVKSLHFPTNCLRGLAMNSTRLMHPESYLEINARREFRADNCYFYRLSRNANNLQLYGSV